MKAPTCHYPLLFVGCDKGSWQMRGRQLADALRAPAVARPAGAWWSSADTIVLVKRAALVWYREAKASGKQLIWDALDFWPQPSGNARQRDELMQTVDDIRRGLQPALLIGATQAMAKAIGGVYLPHHSRAGLEPTPVRERVRVVGYDGSVRYLGTWRQVIERACAQLGLRFVMNPQDLREVDIFVAFRGEQWDGWTCRQWKSGIKYVNAIAAGRPIITQHSAAFSEIDPPGGFVIEDQEHLEAALKVFLPEDRRHEVYQQCRRRYREFQLEAIAERYQKLLRSIGVPACA